VNSTLTGAVAIYLAQVRAELSDLPPGEHILLLDEKTIPEQTKSGLGSQTIKVAAGAETSTLFPVTTLPAQIKKFPR